MYNHARYLLFIDRNSNHREGNFNLTIESFNNLEFKDSIGLNTPIKNIKIKNANNFHSNHTIMTGSFEQISGTGKTEFGLLDVGQGYINISTDEVNGDIITKSLSLNTNKADLKGSVNSLSDQAGADLIKLLKKIKM